MTIDVDTLALARLLAKVLVCLILAVFFALKLLPDCESCYRIAFLPDIERRIGRRHLHFYCRRCWRARNP